MLVTTMTCIRGKKFETLGLVTGSIVQSKHAGKEVASGIKNFSNGELQSYTVLLNDARKVAINRMIYQATELGADAIVATHFASSTMGTGATEILAYGTAVKYYQE